MALSLSGRTLRSKTQERVYPITATAPPFLNDPDVLGPWKAIDSVSDPTVFTPGHTKWRDKLAMDHLIFKADGTTNYVWSWTKGKLYSSDEHTLGNYEIRTIKGKPFLFMAWISGDVVYRGETPSYYVFERDAAYREVESVTMDRTDYAFVDDPPILGTWKPVDFVDEPSQFRPGKCQWQGSPLLNFEIVAYPNGKMSNPSMTWTQGLLINYEQKTASRYEIQTLNGKTYLFYE